MRAVRSALVTALALATTACAAPDPVAFAKGTADFLIIAASQDEYVEACTVRGNSSLECQAEYGDTRAGHQAYYRAKEQHERQQTVDELTAELDAFLKSAENEPPDDQLPD